MTTVIEIYQGSSAQPWKTLPMDAVVRPALERLLGRDLTGCAIQLLLLEVPTTYQLSGDGPMVRNLTPAFGYARVQVWDDRRAIYFHPHPLDELIGQPLSEHLKAELPGVMDWGYRIVAAGIPATAFVRAPPPVMGEVRITGEQALDAGRRLRIRRLDEPPLPVTTLDQLRATPATAPAAPEAVSPVQVVLSRALATELLSSRPFSRDLEEGGFLVGQLYRDGDTADGYLVLVTGAPTAQHTGASLLHFTMTGDSFVEVKRSLQTGAPGQRLLGWFHTHLFPANEIMGLSSIDLRLHFTTFRQPWQVAGLINIDDSGRVLRFYARQDNWMVPCPMWYQDERL